MSRSVLIRTSLLVFLCALGAAAEVAAADSEAKRFGQVETWEGTFEVRFDLDEKGQPYADFSGTRSISGTLRVSDPSEDYGLTWYGSGRATLTAHDGKQTEVELEECFLSVLTDEGAFSAKLGDVAAQYEFTRGSSTHAWAGHLELTTPELRLPATGLVLSHEGRAALGRRSEESRLKFEFRPAR